MSARVQPESEPPGEPSPLLGADIEGRLAGAREILADPGGSWSEGERRDAAGVVLELIDRLEVMLEHTTDMITVLGADGTIRYSNRAAGLITGYGEEVNGSSGLDLIHPEDVPVAAAAFDRCLARAGSEISVEFRLRHFDGTWHWVDAYAKNCVDTPVGGVVVSMRDTTARKQAEDALVSVNDALRSSLAETEAAQGQLVRQERMAAVGELASVVGHELRNPLGVITNSLYLLRAGLPAGDDRLVRQLDRADREVATATAIVSDLLDFARARDPLPAPLEITALVDEVVAAMPAPEGVSVVREVGAPATVTGDRDLLRQALTNLVANAYDAMPDGGTLTVAVLSSSSSVTVAVSDTGAGIDEEILPRIFEPFFTAKTKGAGLGLAVAQRIAAAHQGTLSVDSPAGGGTAFRLRIPTATD